MKLEDNFAMTKTRKKYFQVQVIPAYQAVQKVGLKSKKFKKQIKILTKKRNAIWRRW